MRRSFCVVISRGQPHPQKPLIPEDAAVKFVQPQIADSSAGAYHRGRSYAPVLWFLDFIHPKIGRRSGAACDVAGFP